MKHKNRCRFRHIARSAADRCAKPLPADPVSIARGRVKPALTARAGTRARLLPLSDNGTVVVVKEPRRAVLTPLAVPMSLASSPLRLDRGVLNWLSSIGPLASGGPSLGRPGRSCPVPGCGRHRERAGVGRPAAGAVRLVDAGQAAGRGLPAPRRHRQPRRALPRTATGVARAAGRRPPGHGASAGRRAGLAPVSRATSATSSS